MSHPVMALCRIGRNPERRMKFTGRYDGNGEPILVSDAEIVLPGSIFVISDDEEYDYLTRLEAIRELDELEHDRWLEISGGVDR